MHEKIAELSCINHHKNHHSINLIQNVNKSFEKRIFFFLIYLKSWSYSILTFYSNLRFRKKHESFTFQRNINLKVILLFYT